MSNFILNLRPMYVFLLIHDYANKDSIFYSQTCPDFHHWNNIIDRNVSNFPFQMINLSIKLNVYMV